MNVKNIRKATRRGILQIALLAALSSCAKENKTETNKHETTVSYDTYNNKIDILETINNEVTYERKINSISKAEYQSSNVLFYEVVGQSAVEIVIYDDTTYYLNIINFPDNNIERYQITEEEYLSIQSNYNTFQKKFNRNNLDNEIQYNLNNFEFSIKMPEMNTKESISKELNFAIEKNTYPDSYKKYINTALEISTTGEITKHFLINPISYNEHFDFYSAQLSITSNTMPNYQAIQNYIQADTKNQKIVFRIISGNLVIQKTASNSLVSEMTSFGDIITTTYNPLFIVGETYDTDLITGTVKKTDAYSEEEIASFDPNKKEAKTKTNKTIKILNNYEEYQYQDFIITFLTVPEGNYMFVFDLSTKKLLWNQNIDDNLQKSILFQITSNSNNIKFYLDDRHPDELIDFVEPTNNTSHEDYISLKTVIVNAIEEEPKISTVTIENNTFKVKVISKNEIFSMGQIASNGSQCFFYKIDDGTYSIEYRILKNKCEFWYSGPDLSWTVIDNGFGSSDKIQFRDNQAERKIMHAVKYFNYWGEVDLYQKDTELIIFPGRYLNDRARIREK